MTQNKTKRKISRIRDFWSILQNTLVQGYREQTCPKKNPNQVPQKYSAYRDSPQTLLK